MMTLLWTLLALCALLALTAMAAVVKLARHQTATQARFNQQLELLQRELSVVNNAAIGVGQRLIAVEKKLKMSLEKQQQLDLQHSDYLPYSQATSLAEDGIKAEQLVERYGLPEAEASLMSRLQASR